jgi:integrase
MTARTALRTTDRGVSGDQTFSVPFLDAVDAFVATRGLAPGSRRKYRETLELLARDAAAEISPALLQALAAARWDAAAPATWNRHVATVKSFLRFCERVGYLSRPVDPWLERRRERPDQTRALPITALERLWSRRDVPVREKTLWRLLYETAGRANEVLLLNVEDLELANRRAATVAKGGAREWLHFQSGSARLLPRLIGPRTRGPVFLAALRPSPGRVPAFGDICPVTGRARLSYRRAEELFVAISGGWTLHQLRHSAITHLAEANTGTALLMAKSRHTCLRTMQRYARPGPEAVAALTAAHDPNRRR